MSTTDTIETVLDLPHPQQKVWNAITTPEGLSGWFGNRVTMTLEEGTPIHFEWNEYGDVGGMIETVEAMSCFAYRWRAHGVAEDIEMTAANSTLVTFELTPLSENQTKLRVVETGFANLPPEMRELSHRENSHGWEIELGELVEFLSKETV